MTCSNYLKERYGEKCRLLKTDTYSFLYQFVDTKSDLYLDMMDCAHLWDTSDYHPQATIKKWHKSVAILLLLVFRTKQMKGISLNIYFFCFLIFNDRQFNLKLRQNVLDSIETLQNAIHIQFSTSCSE